MNTKTKALSEAALITALICVVGLAGMYIPFLGLIVYFNFVPLIVLGKRHGIKYTITALAAASVIFGMFAGPVAAISLLLLSGTSSAVMGGLLYMERPPYQVLGGGILMALVSTVIMIGITQLATGIPMAEAMKSIFAESSEIQQSMLDVLKTDAETARNMQEMMSKASEQAILLIPGVIIIWSIVSTFINYWLATLILRKLRTYIPPLPPFREFSLPKSVLLGTVIIYVLSIAATAMKLVDENVLMTNVQMLMIYTFAAQGLSVAVWFMHRRSFSKVVSAIVIIFAIANSFGVTVLFALGVTESAFRVRARVGEKVI